MTHESNASCGCAEYEAMERRQWLQAACRMGAMAMVGAPAWMPRLAFASEGGPTPRDLLVVVFLRGGADGLSLCVPFGDPYYTSSRGVLAVPPPDSSSTARAIDLDGYFGLPPGLASLKPIFDNGHLAVVHATGNPSGIRSHFQDQDRMEMAAPGSSTGWLGRHLLSVTALGEQLRGVATDSFIPRSLGGAPSCVGIPSSMSYGLAGRSSTAAERQAFLAAAYQTADPMLATNASYITSALQLMSATGLRAEGDSSGAATVIEPMADGPKVLDAMIAEGQRAPDPIPGGFAEYPDSPWGRSFKTVAQLAKADIGLEAAAIDLSGWDTHIGQGTTSGYLNSTLLSFAQCLNAFYLDLQDRLGKYTLIVMSEFGRQVAPNSSGGCDHGTGGAMLVMGGNVNGGRVFANWPGLHPDQLYQNIDLAITTDYRDILAEILAKRAGNTALPTVFPGYSPVFRGIII